jgi:glycosyltransferase involved in cell wall biosynthesis
MKNYLLTKRIRVMRIAIITDAWHPQVSGVITTLDKTIETLRDWGHDVKIISPDMFQTIPCPTYPEIALSLLPFKKVRDQLDIFRPNAIHIVTEGPLGWAARRYCQKKNIPFTSSYHTRFPEYIWMRARIPLALSYSVVRRFHNSAKRTMVATEPLQNELQQKGFTNLCLWSRGVDTQLFKPRDKSFLPGKRPISMYVGRVAVEKSIEDFLRLSIPGTKYVVGDGPQLEKLRKEYPDVHFTGYKRGVDLARHISCADVFVFPSRSDTFGNVMLEAMSSGVPVAAYPVTGPIQVVKDGVTGCLSDNLEIAFYGALKMDPRECRKYATQFSWQACTKQFFSNLHLFPETYHSKSTVNIGIKRRQTHHSSRSTGGTVNSFISHKYP